MVNELDTETKVKIEKEVKRMEHIMQHGNRLQKILLVCDMSLVFKVIHYGHAWFKYSSWKLVYWMMRENFDKAKLIWDRKVLA